MRKLWIKFVLWNNHICTKHLCAKSQAPTDFHSGYRCDLCDGDTNSGIRAKKYKHEVYLDGLLRELSQ